MDSDKGVYDKIFLDVEEKVAITFMMFEYFYYMYDNDDEKRQQTLDRILFDKQIKRKQEIVDKKYSKEKKPPIRVQ